MGQRMYKKDGTIVKGCTKYKKNIKVSKKKAKKTKISKQRNKVINTLMTSFSISIIIFISNNTRL